MTTKLPLLAILLILPIYCADAARKSNVDYLRCPVCEEISKQLFSKISQKKAEQGTKKITEYELIELVENICNIKKRESEWIFFMDIVRQGTKLKLVEQPEEGECNEKCKIIQRACQEVIGNHDTDLAEFMFKNVGILSKESIHQALCLELSEACSGRTPTPPEDLDLGGPFTPKASKDAEMARLMRTMNDMDIPGKPAMKVYSKDDLMNLKNLEGEDEDDDDEDEAADQEETKWDKMLKKQKMKTEKLKASLNSKIGKKGEIIPKFIHKLSSLSNHIANKLTAVKNMAEETINKVFGKLTKQQKKVKAKTKATKGKTGVKQEQRAEL